MKKLILSLVFVFAAGAMMNANTNVVVEDYPKDCFSEAWEYGSNMGYSEYSEWFYTNEYYNTHCG